jgi:peptidoglycan/xylan/chitin deacetylase (PgdA/CDA1 family)
MFRPSSVLILSASVVYAMGCAGTALGAECTNKDAIGTSRILEVDPETFSAIGASQKVFTASKKTGDPLPLKHGEIVLTFDDGPVAWSTPKLLDALADQCVRATFFMIGKRADAAPAVVARARAAGHTIASHSWSHTKLSKLPTDQAIEDLVKGYQSVESAAYGAPRPDNTPRFVRFPEWGATPELFAFTHAHNIVAVGADISPEDWRGNPPEVTLDRLRKLLDKHDRGILVLHDNQRNTLAMLPALFAELKTRGMHVVQIVPKQSKQSKQSKQ